MATDRRQCATCKIAFLGTPRAQYCSAACKQKAARRRRPKKAAERNADRNAPPVTVIAAAGEPVHTVEALAVLADLDAELAANAREAGEKSPLELSAADHALRKMIADAIDRKVWLAQAYNSTDDVGLRVKLCTELRLTEQVAAKWLRQIDTELPQPVSLKSQKAAHAANVRHHGVHSG